MFAFPETVKHSRLRMHFGEAYSSGLRIDAPCPNTRRSHHRLPVYVAKDGHNAMQADLKAKNMTSAAVCVDRSSAVRWDLEEESFSLLGLSFI
ncbi:unnamed protein product [Trichobilharzia regenti]|nr:unnamed protein product [Trichobilharzia regenti]